MRSTLRSVALLLTLGTGIGTAVLAQEASQPGGGPPASGAASARRVHRVEKGPFSTEVSLRGVFESQQATELSMHLEAWTTPTVKKAVEHGARVSRGDTLIWFDTRKLDQAIGELQAEARASELAIKQAEQELQGLEKSLPLDMEAAERAKKLADEDLHRFLTKERPLSEKSAHQAVKQMRNMLEYQMEELRQLEKMYKADDLTEETEEIILKRTRDDVESYENYLASSEAAREQTLEVELPRREHAAQELARKQALNWERTQILLPLAIQLKRVMLEKLKYDQGKTAERLEQLAKDREALEFRAPADGVVYYGRSLRGMWTTAAQVAARLQPGGTVGSDEVLLTIVQPQALAIRALIGEEELGQLRAGVKGKATPAAWPELRLECRVESVSGIPLTTLMGDPAFGPRSQFDVRLSLAGSALGADSGGAPTAPVPGMTCKVKLVTYEQGQALTLPVAAVHTDPRDDTQHFVYVVAGDDKTEKRAVKAGRRTDQRVEILEGLSEGNTVSETP